MYLAWFDADRKKSPTKKIADAHARYLEKFGKAPKVCLVSGEDACESELVAVEVRREIGRYCFWIGEDDTESTA